MNTSYKTKLILIISSVGKTLLVASLVLSIGWTLVQVAQWKNRKPVVEPESNGTIILLADAAEILGTGSARVEVYAGKRNIGWWDNTTQRLSWRINVAQSGTYRAILEYSLPKGHQTDFQVVISDETLYATAIETGAWDIWDKMDVGIIELTTGKKQSLTMTPIHINRKGVMNFVSLRLEPDGNKKPNKPDAGDGK